MRALALILIWIVIFMSFFFLLSLVGLLWYDSYKIIITSREWFFAYAMLLGWWIATIPVIETDKEWY